MGLFGGKTPMEKWRSKNGVAAAFVDHSGWDVDLSSGAVHTVLEGVEVTVLAHYSGTSGSGIIIEAGAQARRTLTNTIGDDGGDPYEFEGWQGQVAPGSGLLEASGRGGPELYDKVVAAATDLAKRVRQP